MCCSFLACPPNKFSHLCLPWSVSACLCHYPSAKRNKNCGRLLLVVFTYWISICALIWYRSKNVKNFRLILFDESGFILTLSNWVTSFYVGVTLLFFNISHGNRDFREYLYIAIDSINKRSWIRTQPRFWLMFSLIYRYLCSCFTIRNIGVTLGGSFFIVKIYSSRISQNTEYSRKLAQKCSCVRP